MACQEDSKSCDCRATAPIYLISHATGMERLPLGEGAKQKRAKPQNYKYHPGASSGCSANATWQKKRPQGGSSWAVIGAAILDNGPVS